jgi:hypothetical protein
MSTSDEGMANGNRFFVISIMMMLATIDMRKPVEMTMRTHPCMRINWSFDLVFKALGTLAMVPVVSDVDKRLSVSA